MDQFLFDSNTMAYFKTREELISENLLENSDVSDEASDDESDIEDQNGFF